MTCNDDFDGVGGGGGGEGGGGEDDKGKEEHVDCFADLSKNAQEEAVQRSNDYKQESKPNKRSTLLTSQLLLVLLSTDLSFWW